MGAEGKKVEVGALRPTFPWGAITLNPTLPWDLFMLAEQMGEGFGRYVQLTGILLPATSTTFLTVPIPDEETWWVVNMEWSRLLPNEVRYTFILDGADRTGQTDIVMTQSMIGAAICPPTGGSRMTRSLGVQLDNLTTHPVLLDGT